MVTIFRSSSTLYFLIKLYQAIIWITSQRNGDAVNYIVDIILSCKKTRDVRVFTMVFVHDLVM